MEENIKRIEELAREHAQQDMRTTAGYSVNPLDDEDDDDDDDDL